MLSRMRIVTILVSKVSKSTVKQNGVPMASCRRYLLPIEPEVSKLILPLILFNNWLKISKA